MISLEDIFVQVGEHYKMELIAGKNGTSTSIGWVHLVEDPTIIQFLWSNDLALTLGVSFQEEEALMDCIKRLIKRNCAGLIINTGKYIMEIPQSIIDYCEENNFPLITIPWEINVNTVIKDISIRCQEAQNEDQRIAQYFIKSINDPDQIETYRQELMSKFDVDGNFQVVLIRIHDANNSSDIQLQRVAARIRYYFENIDCKYLLFWYDSNLVLLANNISSEDLKSLTQRMYNRATRRMAEYPLHIGIGSSLVDLHNVPKAYKRAKAALRHSLKFDQPITEFKDMDVYQFLFSMEDKGILKDFYHQQLDPIIEYDEKHHSDLLTTFEVYLKHMGSIQMIAQELYTHRNTINYRVQKIKALLDSDLDNSDELFKYTLAFYIKKMANV